MEKCHQGLASLVAETQAMYETKGILEAQPYGSPAVEIVGLPTPYRRPLRPGPCLPDGLPERPLILPGRRRTGSVADVGSIPLLFLDGTGYWGLFSQTPPE